MKLPPRLLVLLNIFFLSACHQSPDTIPLSLIANTIYEDNQFIAKRTNELAQVIEDKSLDTRYTGYAAWAKLAQQEHALVSKMKIRIDTLRLRVMAEQSTERFIKSGSARQLFTGLTSLHAEVAKVFLPANQTDERMQKTLKSDSLTIRQKLIRIPDSLDVESWTEKYFANTTPAGSVTILDKFAHDIIMIDYRLLDYCNSNINVLIESFDKYDFIISPSSTYLKKGQQLEIKAGAGVFSLISKPSFYFNGLKVQPDHEGVAVFKAPVNEGPGKHSVLVKIEFHNKQDSLNVITKQINYIIAE